MNYLKVYCNLIRKAENRTPPEGYTEKHHTFPKSIFGNNNRIVILTGREHYIAHVLLEKICIQRYGLNHKNTQRMLCAHINMKSKGRYYNSFLYESAKIKRSKSMMKENHWNWKGGSRSYYIKKSLFDVSEKYKRYEYMLISPDGENIITNSLRKTCAKYKLDHTNMNRVIKGERNHHKGWTGKILRILSI
jgi:hypothetical protein